MQNRKPEAFDCLGYKWRIQEEIYEETKGLSPEELREYFRRAAEEFWKEMGKVSRKERPASHYPQAEGPKHTRH